LTDVTVAQTKTATRIAKPSIHAVDRLSLSAVATSIIIENIAATSNTLIVKSSNASKNNSMNPFGTEISYKLLPKAVSLRLKSSSVPDIPKNNSNYYYYFEKINNKFKYLS